MNLVVPLILITIVICLFLVNIIIKVALTSLTSPAMLGVENYYSCSSALCNEYPSYTNNHDFSSTIHTCLLFFIPHLRITIMGALFHPCYFLYMTFCESYTYKKFAFHFTLHIVNTTLALLMFDMKIILSLVLIHSLWFPKKVLLV